MASGIYFVEEPSAVQFYFSTRRQTFAYNKDKQGLCVGLCMDVDIHIDVDDKDDNQRFRILVPCPNCEEESAQQLFNALCDILDRYNIPDYWTLDLVDSVFDLYVTPAANRCNCRRLATDRSAPQVTVFIQGEIDDIAAMPDCVADPQPQDVQSHHPLPATGQRFNHRILHLEHLNSSSYLPQNAPS